MRRRDEHEVAGRPGVERPMREHAGHPQARHLLDVVPAEHLPLIGEERVEPGVVWTVSNGVVVEVRNRFVQIVQHLRFPIDISLKDILSKL